MNAQDKRFLCGVHGQGVPFSTSPPGALPHARLGVPRRTSDQVQEHGLDVGGLDRVVASPQGGTG